MDATIVSGRRVAERYRLVAPRHADQGSPDAWDAVDETLRRNVVIHLLANTADDDTKQHFRAEARTLARLNHRNVVATYDTGVDGDGMSYRVEELSSGKPLDLHAVDDDHRVSYATQLAEAFAAAHAGGLAHRSMTSGCVLVDDEGRVQVLGLRLPTDDVAHAHDADVAALVRLITALAPPVASPLRELAIGWKSAPPPSTRAMADALAAIHDDAHLPPPETRAVPVTDVPRPRRGSRAPVVAIVTALAVAAIAAAIVLPNNPKNDAFDGPVAALALTAKSFDPEANPPTEREPEARLAVDGSTATGWATERYRSVNFGRLKSGVGLILQPTTGNAEFEQVVITSPTRDWSVQVYVAPQPSSTLTGWGEPLASTTVRASSTTLTLAKPTGGAVLVWINSSGPNLQIRIDEVVVRGRA